MGAHRCTVCSPRSRCAAGRQGPGGCGGGHPRPVRAESRLPAKESPGSLALCWASSKSASQGAQVEEEKEWELEKREEAGIGRAKCNQHLNAPRNCFVILVFWNKASYSWPLSPRPHPRRVEVVGSTDFLGKWYFRVLTNERGCSKHLSPEKPLPAPNTPIRICPPQ